MNVRAHMLVPPHFLVSIIILEIPRRVGENDDHYRESVWGIWPDSVGEEHRDSLDAGAGETAEERGIAATTTCHRSSGAKVRPDHPVPILGWVALSTKMANSRKRSTTGAEQRGHASGGSPGSSSTGRELRGDSRFDC